MRAAVLAALATVQRQCGLLAAGAGGYDPTAKSLLQNIYVVYLLAIVGFWLFTMWAWLSIPPARIGSSAEPGAFAGYPGDAAAGVMVVQVFVDGGGAAQYAAEA